MYKEEDAPASQKFSLRAQSVGYITVWGFAAVVTTSLAFLSGEWGDAVNVTGLFIAEFVAICMWRHYFEHGEVVAGLIKETRKRMLHLLVVGLGLSASELEQHLLMNETAVVAMLSQKLKEKPWKCLSAGEKDVLLYDIGMLSAKVLQDHLWEGVLYGAISFFSEWRAELEHLKQELRMPKACKQDLQETDGSVNKNLLCVAVMIANEDKQLREKRGPSPTSRVGRQFCAARIARRKAAAEGILRWPDCMLPRCVMEIKHLEADVSNLSINKGGGFVKVENMEELPSGVLYTLREVICAAYIKANEVGPTEVTITFQYGSMVFPKDLWNPLRMLARQPFRYITSATWMSGNVAFVVEQREALGAGVVKGGSGSLEGTLKLSIIMKENDEQGCWVDQSKPSDASAWGDLKDIDNHKHVGLINLVTICSIKVFWVLISYIIVLRSKIITLADKLPTATRQKNPKVEPTKCPYGSMMNILITEVASVRPLDRCPVSKPLQKWFTHKDSFPERRGAGP